MFLECVKDIDEYNIKKGSLWKVIDNYPIAYVIEVQNCNGMKFLINGKWSFYFKFLG